MNNLLQRNLAQCISIYIYIHIHHVIDFIQEKYTVGEKFTHNLVKHLTEKIVRFMYIFISRVCVLNVFLPMSLREKKI